LFCRFIASELPRPALFFLIEHHLTQLTKRSSKEKEKYELGQGCGKESAFSILSVQLFFFSFFFHFTLSAVIKMKSEEPVNHYFKYYPFSTA